MNVWGSISRLSVFVSKPVPILEFIDITLCVAAEKLRQFEKY